MRSTHLWGHVAVSAWAALAGTATIAGCASDQSECPTSDSGSSDDSSADVSVGADASGGLIEVNGTYTDTLCPSVNPLSLGPDDDGLVSVGATFNGNIEEAGVFTLMWTATSGAFTDAHALDTTFECLAPGNVTVTFTVSGAGCNQQSSGSVTCNAVVGGHP